MPDPPHTLPPFDLTENILDLVAEICEAFGRLSANLPAERRILLRRANRIRTIHASLAIEGNTLSLDQVEAVLEGQQVIGPAREIQEVRNALDAYERIDTWNPGSQTDLCTAHSVLMADLVDRPGAFRRGAAGIVGGGEVVHIAPPADRVPFLIDSLLSWLTDATVHPLVLSCVFHYEFEFIHPFVDGNGRLGRLWQTLILSQWNPLCTVLPIEHVIRERQPAYYNALRESDAAGKSTRFITFMLSAIREALFDVTGQITGEITPQVGTKLAPSQYQIAILNKCHESNALVDLMAVTGRSDRTKFRHQVLNPLIEEGFIEMTVPDKPRSSKQRYRLTEKGRRWLEDGGGSP